MSTLVVEYRVSGTADADDLMAMNHAIEVDNVRRAALTPPLPPLGTATATMIKTSYQTVLTDRAKLLHAANIEKGKNAKTSQAGFNAFRSAYAKASDAQRAASLAALTT